MNRNTPYFATLFVKGEAELQNPFKRSPPLKAENDGQAWSLAQDWLRSTKPQHYIALRMILRQDDREVRSQMINDLNTGQ